MRTSAEWQSIIDDANRISTLLKDKPKELRLGYRVCPGGILNAYREGDLTFDEAVAAVEKLSANAIGEPSPTKRVFIDQLCKHLEDKVSQVSGGQFVGPLTHLVFPLMTRFLSDNLPEFEPSAAAALTVARQRIPKRVRMLTTVRGDLPFIYKGRVIAIVDQEYEVEVNPHGAVSAILPDGKSLGLKPNEFQVVEFTFVVDERIPPDEIHLRSGVNSARLVNLAIGATEAAATATPEMWRTLALDRVAEIHALNRECVAAQKRIDALEEALREIQNDPACADKSIKAIGEVAARWIDKIDALMLLSAPLESEGKA